ncbi:MAG: ATP-binding cassette domain-containing protein [Paracoccaceae bacterium]
MLAGSDLHLRLGGRAALRGATLALRSGEVTALLGPNGAGKSTCLACLSGALRPDAGRVSMDGVDPGGLSPAALAEARAVLEQSPAEGLPFTVAALATLAIPRRIAPAEAEGIRRRALAAAGLAGFAERPVRALSGGERRRAHLARALAQLLAGRALGAGRWLLLDEPTAGLDLAHQAAILRAARAAAAEGAGVLAVLHDLALAAAFADRVAIMAEGRVVAEGPPAGVLTPDRLAEVYGLPVEVRRRADGALAVAPLYHLAEEPKPCTSP